MVAEARAVLHFSRFEFKYVLSRVLRDQIEVELQHFVELDPFVRDQEGHRYVVRSLYFDDPALTAFHDKIDGLHTRSKFRVRTYTRQPGDGPPWFLEIKGRYNNQVFKHRVPIDLQGLDQRAAGDELSEQVLGHIPPGRVRDEFGFQLLRRRIRPMALVDYDRRPYISRFDPEFRLTLDENLSCTETRTLRPSPGDRCLAMVPGYTVMEVKFRRHVPSWFHRIIQAFELQRRSISKICEGMLTLGLGFDS